MATFLFNQPIIAPLIAAALFALLPLAQIMPDDLNNLDVLGVLIFVITNMVWMFVRDRNHRNEMEKRDAERDRRMEQTLQQKEKEFRAIMTQIVDERDSRIAKLEDSMDLKDRQYLQVIGDNQAIAQKNSHLETLNEQNRRTIDDLNSRITLKEKSIEKLNDRLYEMQSHQQLEREERDAERKELLKELNELRRMRDVVVPELRQQIQKLREEVEKVQHDEAQKRRELEAANARLMQEMDEKEALQSEVNRLVNELKHAKQRIGELEGEALNERG